MTLEHLRRGRGRPLAVDLLDVAHHRGHESVEHLFRDLYVTKDMSIEEVANDLNMSYQATKRWLKKLNIPLRGRGGAQNVKIAFTQELVNEIIRDGVTAVSLRLGVDRSTLLYHLRKMKI